MPENVKPMLIDGQWITTSHSTPNINPSDTNDIIDHFAEGGVAEAEKAIAAASTAFIDLSLIHI